MQFTFIGIYLWGFLFLGLDLKDLTNILVETSVSFSFLLFWIDLVAISLPCFLRLSVFLLSTLKRLIFVRVVL